MTRNQVTEHGVNRWKAVPRKTVRFIPYVLERNRPEILEATRDLGSTEPLRMLQQVVHKLFH